MERHASAAHSSWKLHQHALTRRFRVMHLRWLAHAACTEAAAPPDYLERVVAVWEAFAAERRRSVGDMEVEMWLRRVACIPHEPHHLSAFDLVANLHANGAGLEMRVEGKSTV